MDPIPHAPESTRSPRRVSRPRPLRKMQKKLIHAAETDPNTREMMALGRVLIALRFLPAKEVRICLLRAQALTNCYPTKEPGRNEGQNNTEVRAPKMA